MHDEPGAVFLLLSADSVLLPRQPERRRGDAGAGGGGRARGGAIRAGGDPVQRQRRRQVGPRPARRRGDVRARGSAGPRGRAPRARALPPGRLRRAARPGGGPPPPRGRERARAHSGARRRPRLRRAPARRGVPPPLGLRVEPPRGGPARGEPVHGGLVGVPRGRGPRREVGRRQRRRGAPALLPRPVRAARDAAARVPAVLRVRRGQLLLPRVPGAGLEAGAQGAVRAHGAVAARRRRGGGGTAVTRIQQPPT
jgi:hypothetical protein